jgi:hypothetical protein
MAVALLATPAWAQPQLGTTNLGPPLWEAPIPLMWGERDEGFYVSAEAVVKRMNNPLRYQVVAKRGFVDLDGSIRGDQTGPIIEILDPAGNFITALNIFRGPAGAIYGSQDIALTTRDVDRDLFQPGARLSFGYRMRDGITFEISYEGITKSRQNAFAGTMPKTGNAEQDADNSFLYGDFYNFSPYFGGPNRDVISDVFLLPLPAALLGGGSFTPTPWPQNDLINYRGYVIPAYGITNGAEFWSISHLMAIHMAQLNVRVPVLQVEGTRTYWVGGFRYISHTERFRMQVEDIGFSATPTDPFNGGDEGTVSNPEWSLRYTVKQKNHYYGLQTGVGGEAYLFNGFAIGVDLKAGVFAENSRTTTVLQRLDLDSGVGIKRTNNQINMAAMIEGGAYLWWYAHEGITFRFGYEYMGLIGARRITEPLIYDWGNLNVRARNTWLSLDGIVAGVSFVF